jgi:hypothetical protein
VAFGKTVPARVAAVDIATMRQATKAIDFLGRDHDKWVGEYNNRDICTRHRLVMCRGVRLIAGEVTKDLGSGRLFRDRAKRRRSRAVRCCGVALN